MSVVRGVQAKPQIPQQSPGIVVANFHDDISYGYRIDTILNLFQRRVSYECPGIIVAHDTETSTSIDFARKHYFVLE